MWLPTTLPLRFSLTYYLQICWKCDNVLTTNKGDNTVVCVDSYFCVWLHSTLDLSHFRDEQDWDGNTVIWGLATINSIQLVLISATERKRQNNKLTGSTNNEMDYSWVKAYQISQLYMWRILNQCAGRLMTGMTLLIFKRHEISAKSKSNHDNKLPVVWCCFTV